ncbi:hypothetical protein BJ166DRAFT_612223 [Pestalotiopsis sp. NC0098]|nr:hypothetical protein BJ166DRAFT_612223 [Pestalotiopsis sp. NC0098]
MPAKDFTPTSDGWTKLYTLSFFSGAVGNMVGTQASLQNAIDDVLPGEIQKLDSNWALSWGPRVYKRDPEDVIFGPDNVWYAAANESEKLILVAVAGTAAKSEQGWLVIDGDVRQTVDFQKWIATWTSDAIPKPEPSFATPSTARAAMGTCIGVWNVASSTSDSSSPGTTIGQYLATKQDYTAIFSGHSMGGAVAPVTALALLQSKVVSPNKPWYILPSAGATPGNQKLVDLMTAQFPPGNLPSDPEKQYEVFNRDLYNTLDVVPQAWSLDGSSDRRLDNIKQNRRLDNIKQMYAGLRDPAADDLGIVVDGLKVLSRASGIEYEPIVGAAFAGVSFDASSLDPSNLDAVEKQVYTEHITAYTGYFGITDVISNYSDKIRAHPGVEDSTVKSSAIGGGGKGESKP